MESIKRVERSARKLIVDACPFPIYRNNLFMAYCDGYNLISDRT